MNIVHRDLKPLNVLLDDKMRPVICDLGFARILNESLNGSAVTTTMYYQAPETRDMDSNYTLTVDIFSCGLMFAEIITGKSWIAECETQSGSRQKRKQKIPRNWRIHLEELDTLVRKMCSEDPSQRGSFEEIVINLEDPNYWLAETNSAEFLGYKDELDRGEISVPVSPALHEVLKVVSDADAFLDKVEKIISTLPESNNLSFTTRCACFLGALAKSGCQTWMKRILECWNVGDGKEVCLNSSAFTFLPFDSKLLQENPSQSFMDLSSKVSASAK
jgi:serine/threonine protein kinase